MLRLYHQGSGRHVFKMVFRFSALWPSWIWRKRLRVWHIANFFFSLSEHNDPPATYSMFSPPTACQEVCCSLTWRGRSARPPGRQEKGAAVATRKWESDALWSAASVSLPAEGWELKESRPVWGSETLQEHSRWTRVLWTSVAPWKQQPSAFICVSCSSSCSSACLVTFISGSREPPEVRLSIHFSLWILRLHVWSPECFNHVIYFNRIELMCFFILASVTLHNYFWRKKNLLQSTEIAHLPPPSIHSLQMKTTSHIKKNL